MKDHFNIYIITMFNDYFDSFLNNGLAGSALSGHRDCKFNVKVLPLSNFSKKDFKGVDDSPYGGGPGMVIRADVLAKAIYSIDSNINSYEQIKDNFHIVYTGPRGKVWNNKMARSFADDHWSDSSKKDLIFICGRYEGIDERFIEKYVDEHISIGDYILTGGEIAVMAIIDSAIRFSPNVLGNKNSSAEDSFEDNLLEHAQYTRPSNFEGLEVPSVLMSGDHKKIKEFQYNQKIEFTKKYRPDLYNEFLRKRSE